MRLWAAWMFTVCCGLMGDVLFIDGLNLQWFVLLLERVWSKQEAVSRRFWCGRVLLEKLTGKVKICCSVHKHRKKELFWSHSIVEQNAEWNVEKRVYFHSCVDFFCLWESKYFWLLLAVVLISKFGQDFENKKIMTLMLRPFIEPFLPSAFPPKRGWELLLLFKFAQLWVGSTVCVTWRETQTVKNQCPENSMFQFHLKNCLMSEN